jgi:hypothetical protein
MYNQVFERFYDNDEDQVRALIAYGLYKVAKREWFIDFEQKNDRTPNSQEISAYNDTWTLAQLNGKHSEANVIMIDYANTLIENVKPDIVRETLKGTWLDTILKNIASAVIYTVLLFTIAISLKATGIDLLGIVSSIKPQS